MKLIRMETADGWVYVVTVNDLLTELSTRMTHYRQKATDELEIGMWHNAVDDRAMADAYQDLRDDIYDLIDQKRKEMNDENN